MQTPACGAQESRAPQSCTGARSRMGALLTSGGSVGLRGHRRTARRGGLGRVQAPGATRPLHGTAAEVSTGCRSRRKVQGMPHGTCTRPRALRGLPPAGARRQPRHPSPAKRLPARPAIKSSDKVPGIIPPPAKSRCSILPQEASLPQNADHARYPPAA